ncbi:MAG: integration host factor subunit alpha [Pseudomonadota bacterium]
MVEKTVTRADLAEAVYRLNIENRDVDPPEPISREESAALVEAVLDEIADALVEGETVKLSSFGAFSVREKGARVGRNPKTGVEAPISPRRVPSFRASQVLKALINGEAEEAEAPTKKRAAAEAIGAPNKSRRAAAR